MSVSQATSFVFETSCTWCIIIRRSLATFLSKFVKGIIFSRQIRANYQIAERLVGQGEFEGMTIAEVVVSLNKSTL